MKIYTKKGDEGQTSLYGGERVSKDSLRIHAYGTLDELNACLGWVLAYRSSAQSSAVLAQSELPSESFLSLALLRIQGELFQLGAEMATPSGKKVSSSLISSAHIEMLEKEIDRMEASLAPLKTFILPGGTEGSARLHMARTVSRRAEREIITHHRIDPFRAEVLQYVNRLSDYLFVAARFANHELSIEDVPWISK